MKSKMEKSANPPAPGGRRKSRTSITTVALSLILLILTLYPYRWVIRQAIPIAFAPHDASGRAQGIDPDHTDWDTIPPSEKLAWTPCFRALGADFRCARLTVPMDYGRPLDAAGTSPKVHVALVLLPGAGHGEEEAGQFSGSPLLINPGGPGGSGTSIVLGAGRALQEAVGRHRDVIGFDPRGIGATWPPADCFLPPLRNPDGGDDYDVLLGGEERHRALMHRLTWDIEALGLGLPNASDDALVKLATREKAMGKLCEAHDREGSIFRYLGTPHVARDLLSIVRAWDEWAAGFRNPSAAVRGAETPGSSVPDTRDKLVYWGFSYGTLLGATFASMFPESVGRLVLDGVVDSDVYFRNAWKGSLRDIDAILEKFFIECHEAGEACRLYRPDDTAEDIRDRFDFVMAKVDEEPLTFVTPEVRIPVMVTASHIKQAIFQSMYTPQASFPTLALLIDSIYRGRDISSLTRPPDMASSCSQSVEAVVYPEDSSRAIWCSDSRYRWNETYPELEALFAEMAKQSSFADVWISLTTKCSGWRIEPRDPPSLDWGEFPMGDRAPVDTSFPIMFVSNTHDPVTPLRSGLAMSQRFTGAGFLEQTCEGHCSIACVSLCTIKKIRAYLDDGVVPSPPALGSDPLGRSQDVSTGEWEKCEVDQRPWGLPGAEDSRGLSAEDVAAVQAWRDFQDAFRRLNIPPPTAGSLSHLGAMTEEEVLDHLAGWEP